jgi:hypothetical protein
LPGGLPIPSHGFYEALQNSFTAFVELREPQLPDGVTTLRQLAKQYGRIGVSLSGKCALSALRGRLALTGKSPRP